MPTRNVVLTEHQTRFVEALVTSGRYQNASDVLRDGLRLVERREQEQVHGYTSSSRVLQLCDSSYCYCPERAVHKSKEFSPP